MNDQRPPSTPGIILEPTRKLALERHYLRPGGPWDRGSIEACTPRTESRALRARDATMTGMELDALVGALAGHLRSAGATRASTVAWQLPNGIPAVALYRACWRIGAVAAPLHHRLGEREVRAALDQVGPRVVISDPTMPAAGVEGALEVVHGGDPDSLLRVLPYGPSVRAPDSPAEAGDIAVALFTSGSTGVPKAVLHTHRGLGYKATLMSRAHGLGPSDALLMPAPLAHISGLLNGVLIPSLAGLPVTLMDRWDPDEALGLIAAERVTFMGAPPVFFLQMGEAGSFSAEKVRSMRLVSTGGASISPAFVAGLAERFGCTVKRTYGSTEAPTVTTSIPGDPPDRARETDGHALGEVELVLGDPATGAQLDPGSDTGEIWLRGPELFVGYADRTYTEKVIVEPGGWFRTGDLGALDDGWLTVMGRLSDIIIRSGENISASEVEAVLESHPAVRQAVAVGIPDAATGERVAAAVSTSGHFDLATCREWFRSQGITMFKTPELILVLPQIPTLAAGKPDRAAIRALAASEGAPAPRDA